MPVDPFTVQRPGELAAALSQVKTTCGLSLNDIERRADDLQRSVPQAVPLPRSTVSDMCSGVSIPLPEKLRTFLIVCGVAKDDIGDWMTARARALSKIGPVPGAVRVRTADPRLLGVHASIQVDPDAEDLPIYVPRDVDVDLRTAVAAARDRGAFVVVKGSSSVGKTRTLFEAVKAVWPDWWLLHPVDAAAVRAFAVAPTPCTVVWLDELQRYLTQSDGVRAGAVRALLTAKLLVVGTLWPGEYAARTALRIPGQADPYAEDRELLTMARIIEVPDTFSRAERQRAEDLAADSRIRVALSTIDAGVTQVLAAGPELIRWWEYADVTDARQCYGKAVITAALDARRVGATAPLTREFLMAAAPAYLSSAQQADAPPDWFTTAIGYAVTRLHGATACLTPVAAGMGQTAGYRTADYLYQRARQTRRTTALPEPVWQALLDHHDLDDADKLGDNAHRRGQLGYAESFYRQLPDAVSLAYLLVECGRVDEADRMLRQRSDSGDKAAAGQLAGAIVELGRVDELQQRADAGDETAAAELEKRLARRSGGLDASTSSAIWMAVLLAWQGKFDELRQRADEGDRFAADRLADLLTEQGHVDEAIRILRQRADTGSETAANRLTHLLAEHGRADELRQRADEGDRFAADRLADLLSQQGEVDELRHRANAGDDSAADRLADLLAEQGHVDEAIMILRQRADTGNRFVCGRLARLLANHGRVDELRHRADAGDDSAADRLADLLAEQGRVDELRHRADAGDDSAAVALINLLIEQGRKDLLEQEMHAGVIGAAARFAELA